MFRLAALFSVLAQPVLADFAPVRDRDSFLDLLADRQLRHGVLGITIAVLPDGEITGRAVKWDLTGSWSWQDGYFCREMDWSGMEIPFNCQLVEVDGNLVRFTVDKGAGESATFTLN